MLIDQICIPTLESTPKGLEGEIRRNLGTLGDQDRLDLSQPLNIFEVAQFSEQLDCDSIERMDIEFNEPL